MYKKNYDQFLIILSTIYYNNKAYECKMKKYEYKLDKHDYKLDNIKALIKHMMHNNKK